MSFSGELTAVEMEELLQRARVTGFKATFDVVMPNGEKLPFELTMPEGELRQELGREMPDFFVSASIAPLTFGKLVLRLSLVPDPTFKQDKRMVLRVVRDQ